MSRAVIGIGIGAAVVGGIVFLSSRDANAAPGQARPPKGMPNVSPFLFEVAPNGMVSFKPHIAAGLMPMLSQRAFVFPEQGNTKLISVMGLAAPGQDVARNWVIDLNSKGFTIVAVRHLSVPTAPPPNGPMVLMMAIAPGQEVEVTEDPSLFAVFALAKTLAQGAGLQPADPLIPPLPTFPSDDIPPPGVLDDVIPPLPGPFPATPTSPPFVPPAQQGMPPALKAQFDAIMANPLATPDQLRTAAAAMRAAGFEAEAQALESKAAAIEAQQALSNAVPRMLLIPTSGAVTPGHVAIHYTGDIKRFKELATPTNPQIKVVGSGNNQGLSPWVGQTIALPGNWPQKPTPPKGTVEVSNPNLPSGNPFPTVPGGQGQSVPLDPFSPSGDVLADALANFPTFGV